MQYEYTQKHIEVMRDTSLSSTEAANAIGVSYDAVRKWRMNNRIIGHGSKPYRNARDTVICAMHRMGYANGDIASVFGLSGSIYVSRILNKRSVDAGAAEKRSLKKQYLPLPIKEVAEALMGVALRHEIEQC